MELFSWLSAVSRTSVGLHLVQGEGHVTMAPSSEAYACVAQLRKGEVPGTLVSATALLQLVTPDERRFVLLQRDAAAPVDPLRWQFPAGRCSPFENPVETAVREMLEEVTLEGAGAVLLTQAEAHLTDLAPEHALVGPEGLNLRFRAPWVEVANTLEFFVLVTLALPSFEGVRLRDNEPYGRQVAAFSRAEVLALAQAGSLTAAAAAILDAALGLSLV